jgi:hypothetical protein
MRVRHYSVGGDENWYNPARNSSGNVIGCSSDGVSGTRVSEINAAVLTLNNSFTVDGYNCGDVQGFLTVNGALAQRWRGTVGQGVTVNGSGACVASSSGNGHGYCKSYNYDYTFKSQTPPHFLAPTAATWKIIRLRQTLPACACESTR